MHDAEARPSQISAVYWIEAAAPGGPAPTPRAGYWRIHTTLAQVDDLWDTIKAATTAGQLGHKSKVATAPLSDQARDERVIHVRTYDSQDSADVARVRAALLQLGIPDNMTYRTDQEDRR